MPDPVPPAAPAAPKSRPCPMCRKPTPWEGNPYRPFCSQRCQIRDQAAWADDKYSVPAEEEAAPLDEEPGKKEKE